MILRYALKLLIVLAIVVAAYLLYKTLSQYTLADIKTALFAIPLQNLALSLAFAAASYFCLSLFDAMAIRYVGKRLKLWQTGLASFVSLSIGHNVGVAALSSGAVRYRYYSRWGLSAADVALVIMFCGVTVALGLSTLGSAALVLRAQEAAELTGLGNNAIMGLAIAGALFPLLYLVMAGLLRKPVTFRGREWRFPSLKLAILQVIVGTINFAMVAASLDQMLAAFSDANYVKVAAVSIIANVAAIISHIPGGVGVLEATVSAILPGAESVAAVIAFRVAYYFIPLIGGLLLLGASEVAISPGTAAQERVGHQRPDPA